MTPRHVRGTVRIGIDVGGTKCLGVVLDESQLVLASLRKETPRIDELVDVLCDMVSTLRQSTTDSSDFSLGVGVPGLVTPDGMFRASPHIVGVNDFPIAQLLSERMQQKVRVDNDATAAAFGEWQIGAARAVRDVLVVTLGTGIGGGIISGGELQRGAHGHAGEFGHMIVDATGPECACGQRGCWEMYASGSALRRMAQGQSGEDVMDSAAAGNTDALAIVEEFSQWVGRGLAGLVNALDPQMIVIGGGLVRTSDVFLEKVEHHLARHMYGARSRALPAVVPAQLGEQAGAIGSALLGALQ